MKQDHPLFSEASEILLSLGIRPDSATEADVDYLVAMSLISHAEADIVFRVFMPGRFTRDPYEGPAIVAWFTPASWHVETGDTPQEEEAERKRQLQKREQELDDAPPDTITDKEWAAYHAKLLARFHSTADRHEDTASMAA